MKCGHFNSVTASDLVASIKRGKERITHDVLHETYAWKWSRDVTVHRSVKHDNHFVLPYSTGLMREWMWWFDVIMTSPVMTFAIFNFLIFVTPIHSKLTLTTWEEEVQGQDATGWRKQTKLSNTWGLTVQICMGSLFGKQQNSVFLLIWSAYTRYSSCWTLHFCSSFLMCSLLLYFFKSSICF